MARFSLGREDDYDGSSSPEPKRQRMATTPTRRPPPQNPNRNAQEQIDSDSDSAEEEEEEEVYEEDDEVIEEDEEEEEDDEEEEEDEGVEIPEEPPQRGKGKMNEETSESSQGARCSTGDGGISVILSDPDVLDCPICLEPLTVPVFQCENGHVACNCCCSKLKNTCPSCSWPIGYNRCRAIEKVIESIRISCQNSNYGCKETVSYSKKHDHEHICLHAPVSCPHIGCTFISASKKLYQHFSSKHSNYATRFSYNKVFSVPVMRGSSRHVILQEKNEGVIFILNFGHKDLGTVVNVNCIGPTTTKRGCSYELTAKNGETSVVLHSVAENVPNWVEHSPEKAFLVVPREFDGSLRGSVLFNLEVRIRIYAR